MYTFTFIVYNKTVESWQEMKGETQQALEEHCEYMVSLLNPLGHKDGSICTNMNIIL